MLYQARNPGTCWWCAAAPADSREHKLKRSDLVRQFGPGPYEELTSAREDRYRKLQGPNSVLAKFKARMCAKCNNERSQPFDIAYDRFTAYIHEHERHVLASRSVDLRTIYGRDWEPGRDGLLRYMSKHVGCRLAENDVEVPESIRRYLDGGPEPCADLALEFEIRADIAKASKTILAEGSMWLGDVYFSELDAEGRAQVVESHYGYRWLRVAWGVGSDLEGYPGRSERRYSPCRMARPNRVASPRSCGRSADVAERRPKRCSEPCSERGHFDCNGAQLRATNRA